MMNVMPPEVLGSTCDLIETREYESCNECYRYETCLRAWERDHEMSTYEFEVIAKNAVIKQIKKEYDEEYKIDQISVVYMVHLLGHKKAILIDSGNNGRMYEVTYNRSNNEMYVDVYRKKSNTVIDAYEFDLTVEV